MKHALLVAVVVLLAACEDPTLINVGQRAYRTVTTGGDHSCALAVDGAVYCWGRGLDGELGNGGNQNSSRPIRAGSLSFIDVDAGDRHNCAVATDGRAYCWGSNTFHQRGNDDGDGTVPTAVLGNARFRSVSAGDAHTCALAADSTAYCWGRNQYGQIGDGSLNAALAPVQVRGGLKFTIITAGGDHSCGLTAALVAYCWGSNSHGQLGVGFDTANVATPTAVKTLVRFTKISAGSTHTCGISEQLTIWCWGSNGHGELGDGSSFDPNLVGANLPKLLSPLYRVGSAVYAGDHYACAIDQSGYGACWGQNDKGQLGNAGGYDQFIGQPVHLQPNSQFAGDFFKLTSFGAGGRTHVCAISDQAVFCWGSGTFGQLGISNVNYAPLAVRVND